MCWLDEYYDPKTGAPCANLISRMVRDEMPTITQHQEQEAARHRVELRRQVRQLQALNERLLDELAQLKGATP